MEALIGLYKAKIENKIVMEPDEEDLYEQLILIYMLKMKTRLLTY
jgi:hypothetical protein